MNTITTVMMRECVSRKHIIVPSLFPPSVVRTSFTDASLLFKEDVILPSPIAKTIRRQDTKAQANIPIGMALTEGTLSPSLQAVARGLFHCAAGYLQAIINASINKDTPLLTPTSHDALLRAYPLPRTEAPLPLEAFINTASVFRIWTYQCGGDSVDGEPLCRPHCDPGLCTAMLLGSTPGLEINAVDTIRDNGFGDFRGDGGSSYNWSSIAAEEGDALLINNTQLECCTGGIAKQLPHRVVAPQGQMGERINMVVELRARHAKHIFALGGRST